MATGNETAKFSVVLDDQVSGSADDAAESVEALRARLAAGESAVKEMAAAYRKLRGSSDEVKAAKAQLNAKLNAERDAISRAQLALLKSSDAAKVAAEKDKLLSAQKDKLAARAKAMGAALGAAGGPVASLKGKLDALKEIAGQGGGMGIATLAAAGLAVALAAVVAAAGAGFLALSKFIATSANAARSANLLREAASGSAANATALGTQVDALARKLPTGKAALNDLAVSLARGGVQGQALVDTMNAVGQASAAMGDDAGSKLRELVDRGRLSQSFAVNPLELQGTGLQFEDIAKALASQMKVGVDKAKAALAEGRVKLGDGAAALRTAVERKFGDLNLRKMLDLNVISEKLKERFASLTSGVNIEPLLRGFQKLTELFDESTVTGDALKQLVTFIGTGLGVAVEGNVPLVRKLFQGMVIGALQTGIAFLKLRNWFRETFDAKALGGLVTAQTALQVMKGAAVAVGAVLLAVGAAAAVSVAAFVYVGKVVGDAVDAFVGLYDRVKAIEWMSLGSAIVDGIVGGLKNGTSKLVAGTKELAEKIKGGFKDALGIHSPSRVFAGYGENTVEGYTEGVDRKAPEAAQALDSMAAPPRAGGAGGRGPVSISMPVTITVQGGPDVAKQLTDPSFLQQLTKALEDVRLAAGVPGT
jgi:hypothetical protein